VTARIRILDVNPDPFIARISFKNWLVDRLATPLQS
jgi:hypothetical protein